MAMVGGLAVHRAQITFDWEDRRGGRGPVAPATREMFRSWLEQLPAREGAFAVEATTGWRLVVEELQRGGFDASADVMFQCTGTFTGEGRGMSIATRSPAAPGVKVVQPGEGRRGTLGPGLDVVFKIDGDDTGGALSIVEHPFEVGTLVPPHVHHLEDEFSIVLEGEIGFRSEDQEVVLGPGGYIVKPHGEVHAMWNAGRVPARMIEVISPPGFEGFFREIADPNDAGEFDPSQVSELGDWVQLELAEPDWLPDVIARYDLTPPPAP